MKRFKFRFEALEDLRKRQEDEAMKLLAVDRKKYFEAVERRNFIVKKMNESLDRRDRLAGENAQSNQYQLENDFISGSKVRISQADHAIEVARKRLERTMMNYLYARKRKKTMEKIRERQYERYLGEKKKVEAKALDDLYIMRSRILKESA